MTTYGQNEKDDGNREIVRVAKSVTELGEDNTGALA